MKSTSYKTVPCAVGNTVRILTSNKDEDPNTYTVKSLDRQLAILTCEATDRNITIHKSRIIKNLSTKETKTVSDATATADTNAPKAKKAKKAKKVQRAKFDLKGFATHMGEHTEIYSRKAKFDHDSMDVRSIVVIRGDHRGFASFNTYDGSLGRKFDPDNVNFDEVGARYGLADDAAYEKKIAKLKKDGYIKRPI